MSDATKPPDWFNNFNHAIQQKLSAYMPMEDIQVVVEEARKLYAAESASLRERAERAEFDRDNYKAAWTEVDRGLKENREVLSTALADAAALGEQLREAKQLAEGALDAQAEAETRMFKMTADLRIAESLALTNGEAADERHAKLVEVADKLRALRAERDGLRGLLDGIVTAWDDDDISAATQHARLARLTGEARRYLVAHPAIPEGTPTAAEPAFHAQDCLNSCRFVLSSKDWCGVCRLAEDRAPEGPPPGERGTP